MKTLSTNEEAEVTRELQAFLIANYSGVIAHRTEGNKHYVKILDGRWTNHINKSIKKL